MMARLACIQEQTLRRYIAIHEGTEAPAHQGWQKLLTGLPALGMRCLSMQILPVQLSVQRQKACWSESLSRWAFNGYMRHAAVSMAELLAAYSLQTAI